MPKSHRSMAVVLNVLHPEKLAAFYTDVLGMDMEPKGDEIHLGYAPDGASLVLRPSPSITPYQQARSDRYWKIGIALPNIDLAYKQLRAKNIEVSKPHQFKDVGYLCHTSDPEGYQIELLQHTFEGQPRTSEGEMDKPLGGGAQIGQITLRTTDIDADLRRYQGDLGMKLLSIQPVPDYEFTLYFLAFTEENPPNPDLQAIENRPWLYQRAYTTLEIQHLQNPEAHISKVNAHETGLADLRISKP